MPAGRNDDCVGGSQRKASERTIHVGGKDRDTVRKAGRVGIVGAVVDDHDAKSRRCRGAGDRGADMPCPEHKNTRCGHQPRSEEHTSELQSHVNLVCRLLLEKKKKQKKNSTPNTKNKSKHIRKKKKATD